MQRNEEAELAVQGGDTERAIELYENSIREEFVGSHPYERLASVYESRRNPTEALRVSEAFTKLAASGKMPRGAQRSADRKLPEFEARIQRYRRSLDNGDRSRSPKTPLIRRETTVCRRRASLTPHDVDPQSM